MPKAIAAQQRDVEIATPFDPDVLLFYRMHAREELSRLSDYTVELLSHPEHGDVDIDRILGQHVTIKLARPDAGDRFFNGFVTRFAHAGRVGRYNRFVATIRPWTWFLTRTSDCRIFQDMTVPDIVKAVFAGHATADFSFDLTHRYRTWTYCVQYRETDFDFISRLLEREGIFYYFRHVNGRHTMMLTDSNAMLAPAEGHDEIRFYNADQVVPRPQLEYIRRWEFAREVQPGAFVHTDFDLTRPRADLRTEKTLPRQYYPSDYEVYDYPGYYVRKEDGEHYAAVRIDEIGTQFETSRGDTDARGVTVGSTFTLARHPRADQNREYVILSATYDLEFREYEAMPPAEPGPAYQCAFTAMSTAQQFRPARTTRKPFVQGPQTAIVVGPPGDEIYTDEYGRVKVRFHWDREDKADEQSSCWIRVSQAWAGRGWGSLHTPRIGQEVIVDFLEGDPDQPIITGRVYNGENTPPYALPDHAAHSGIKSHSTQDGGASNFNEIRMEDTKGSELLFMQAEQDWRIHVKNSETETVGAGITTSAGGAISRSSGGSQSRTAGDSIIDKAKNTYTLNTGEGQSLKAGGSYSLLTNEGIQLKTIHFVMEQIESGIEGAMASLEGDAQEAVAAAKDWRKGDTKAAEALGNKIGQQMSSAFGPAVGAASGAITTIIAAGAKGEAKSAAQAEAAALAATQFVQAVQNDAPREAIAAAFIGMVVAAYKAYADTRKLIDDLMPRIPSIAMWAMKDIKGEALWNVSFSAKHRDLSLEAKSRDVNVKGKRHVSVEAAEGDLSLKASGKDARMTAKKKLTIKAEDDSLVMETGKSMTVTAAKMIQFKCGDASITLLKGGEILLRGKEIKINSTKGPVTVKGTPIKLN